MKSLKMIGSYALFSVLLSASSAHALERVRFPAIVTDIMAKCGRLLTPRPLNIDELPIPSYTSWPIEVVSPMKDAYGHAVTVRLVLSQESQTTYKLEFDPGATLYDHQYFDTTRHIIEVAMLDAGLDASLVQIDGIQYTAEQPGGYRIQISDQTPAQVIERFQTEIASRVIEMTDSRRALASRLNPGRREVNERVILETENSGWSTRSEFEKELDVASFDHPYLIKTFTPEGKAARIIFDMEWFAAHGGAQAQLPQAFDEARAKPMTPVLTQSGAWIVYSEHTPAIWNGAYPIERFQVFASQVRAYRFIDTHRFVLGQTSVVSRPPARGQARRMMAPIEFMSSP